MKSTLRAQVLMKRKSLPHVEVIQKSKQVKHLLFTSPWYNNAQNILFYVSYDNEVYTHEMIQESLMNGKTVLVPKVDIKHKKIRISKLLSWNELSEGSYSILEPRDENVKEVTASSIHLIIVPGIVFDLQGNRIGHGFGYYDRLLSKTISAHRLGLAFELQLVEKIPAETYDVKVEKIVTEKRIITCR